MIPYSYEMAYIKFNIMISLSPDSQNTITSKNKLITTAINFSCILVWPSAIIKMNFNHNNMSFKQNYLYMPRHT